MEFHSEQSYIPNHQFSNLIADYLVRQNLQECFTEVYSNHKSKLPNSIYNGIKYALRIYNILIIDEPLAYVFSSDKSKYAQFVWNTESGFKTLRQWSYDQRDSIKEVHFRKRILQPMKLLDSIQSLRGVRVLNFAHHGGPQQNSFYELIKNNASKLAILRNCEDGQLYVPNQMVDRLIWIGSKCDVNSTSHYYRTMPIDGITKNNGICYEMWIVPEEEQPYGKFGGKRLENFQETIQNMAPQIQNKITHFRIKISDWVYCATSTIPDILKKLSTLKRNYFRNLQNLTATFTFEQENHICHQSKQEYSIIKFANYLRHSLQEIGPVFNGLNTEFKVQSQIVFYCPKYEFRAKQIGMETHMRCVNLLFAKEIWAKMEWDVQQFQLTGKAVADNLVLQFDYRIIEHKENSTDKLDLLQSYMKSIDKKFDE